MARTRLPEPAARRRQVARAERQLTGGEERLRVLGIVRQRALPGGARVGVAAARLVQARQELPALRVVRRELDRAAQPLLGDRLLARVEQLRGELAQARRTLGRIERREVLAGGGGGRLVAALEPHPRQLAPGLRIELARRARLRRDGPGELALDPRRLGELGSGFGQVMRLRQDAAERQPGVGAGRAVRREQERPARLRLGLGEVTRARERLRVAHAELRA